MQWKQFWKVVENGSTVQSNECVHFLNFSGGWDVLGIITVIKDLALQCFCKVLIFIDYCKWGKIHWAKLPRFLWFLRVPRKFSRELLALVKINNKHCWPRHRESIPMKNFIGQKLRMFSPANLSRFTVCTAETFRIYACEKGLGNSNSQWRSCDDIFTTSRFLWWKVHI